MYSMVVLTAPLSGYRARLQLRFDHSEPLTCQIWAIQIMPQFEVKACQQTVTLL